MGQEWPIRVGGEYIPRETAGTGMKFVKRVIAIEGGRVYYVLAFGDGDVSKPRDTIEKVFRNLSFPEDQSPLPAVENFLERLVAGEVDYPAGEAEELLRTIKGEA